MKNLVICEICGTTFNTNSNLEICGACFKRKKSINKNTKIAQFLRIEAKKLGAKALTGSPKQKEWGERLRREFILNAHNIELVEILICYPSLETATFWIENKDNKNLESDLIEILTIAVKLNAGEEADFHRRMELIEKLGI